MEIFSTRVDGNKVFLKQINGSIFSFFSPDKGVSYGRPLDIEEMNEESLQKMWYPLEKTTPKHFLNEIFAHCSSFSSQIEFINGKDTRPIKKRYKFEEPQPEQQQEEEEFDLTPTQLKSHPSQYYEYSQPFQTTPIHPHPQKLRIKPSQTLTPRRERGEEERKEDEDEEQVELLERSISLSPFFVDEPLIQFSQTEKMEERKELYGSFDLNEISSSPHQASPFFIEESPPPVSVEEMVFDPLISNLITSEFRTTNFINDLFESIITGKGGKEIEYLLPSFGDPKIFKKLKKQYLSDKFVYYSYFTFNAISTRSDILIKESEVINLTIILDEIETEMFDLIRSKDYKHLLSQFINLERIKIIYNRNSVEQPVSEEEFSLIVDNILASRFFETVILENENVPYLNKEKFRQSLWDCRSLYCSQYIGVLPLHVEKLVLKDTSNVIDQFKSLRIIHYYGQSDLLSKLNLQMVSEINSNMFPNLKRLHELKNLTRLELPRIDIRNLPPNIVSLNVKNLTNDSKKDPNEVCPITLRFVKVYRIEPNVNHVPNWIESYSVASVRQNDGTQLKLTLNSLKIVKVLEFGTAITLSTHIENVEFPKTCFCIDLGNHIFDYMGMLLPSNLIKLEVVVSEESEIEQIKGALVRVISKEGFIRLKELLITTRSDKMNLLYIRKLFREIESDLNVFLIEFFSGKKTNVFTGEEEKEEREGRRKEIRTWKRRMISKIEGDIQDIDSKFAKFNPFMKTVTLKIKFSFRISIPEFESQDYIGFIIRMTNSETKPYGKVIHPPRQLYLQQELNSIRRGKEYGPFSTEFTIKQSIPKNTIIEFRLIRANKTSNSYLIGYSRLSLEYFKNTIIPLNRNETKSMLRKNDSDRAPSVHGSMISIKIINDQDLKKVTFV